MCYAIMGYLLLIPTQLDVATIPITEQNLEEAKPAVKAPPPKPARKHAEHVYIYLSICIITNYQPE